MSGSDDDLYDDSLPDESGADNRLLRYVVLGVLAILVYALVVLYIAATGGGL